MAKAIKNLQQGPVLGFDGEPIHLGDQIVATSSQGFLNAGTYLGFVEIERENGSTPRYAGQDWVQFKIYYLQKDGKRRFISGYGWVHHHQSLLTDRMVKR